MKIITQVEHWIPHLESELSSGLSGEFKNLVLSFGPKPRLIGVDTSAPMIDNGAAVSIRGTYQKILNKALLHNSPPEDIPTHILTIGKGSFNDKAIDLDYSDILVEYDSKDYKVPEIIYVDTLSGDFQNFVNKINDNIGKLERLVEETFFSKEPNEVVEVPVKAKRTRKNVAE